MTTPGSAAGAFNFTTNIARTRQDIEANLRAIQQAFSSGLNLKPVDTKFLDTLQRKIAQVTEQGQKELAKLTAEFRKMEAGGPRPGNGGTFQSQAGDIARRQAAQLEQVMAQQLAKVPEGLKGVDFSATARAGAAGLQRGLDEIFTQARAALAGVGVKTAALGPRASDPINRVFDNRNATAGSGGALQAELDRLAQERLRLAREQTAAERTTTQASKQRATQTPVQEQTAAEKRAADRARAEALRRDVIDPALANGATRYDGRGRENATGRYIRDNDRLIDTQMDRVLTGQRARDLDTKINQQLTQQLGQQQQLTQAARLAAQVRAGTARLTAGLGGSVVTDDNRVFRRGGERVTRSSDPVGYDNALRLRDAQIAREQQDRERAAQRQARDQSLGARGGITNSFLGGLTSRGFGDGGGFRGNLDGLAVSAGTLTKFQALSTVLGGTTQAVGQLKKEAFDYIDSQTAFNIALGEGESVGKRYISTLSDISRQAGSNVGEALDTAARGVGAFARATDSVSTKQDVGADFANVASQLRVLTGKDLKDATGDIIAVANAFELVPSQLQQVNDAVVNARRSFAADPGQISQGLASLGVAAAEAGFSVDEAANIIGLATSRLDESGTLAAQRLSKVFTILGGTAGQGAIGKVNQALLQNKDSITSGDNAGAPVSSLAIDQNGTVKEQLAQLADAYGYLGEAQQKQLRNSLGGTQASRELILLLKEQDDLQRANDASARGAGNGVEEFRKRLSDITGQVRQITGALKSLSVGLVNSGFLDIFGAAIYAIQPFLTTLSKLLEFYTLLPGPLKTLIALTLEFILVQRLALGLIARGGAGLIPGRVGGFITNRAAQTGVAGTATQAGLATRAGGIQTAAGTALGAAEDRATAAANRLAAAQAELAASTKGTAAALRVARAEEQAARAQGTAAQAAANAEVVAAQRAYAGSILAGQRAVAAAQTEVAAATSAQAAASGAAVAANRTVLAAQAQGQALIRAAERNEARVRTAAARADMQAERAVRRAGTASLAEAQAAQVAVQERGAVLIAEASAATAAAISQSGRIIATAATTGALSTAPVPRQALTLGSSLRGGLGDPFRFLAAQLAIGARATSGALTEIGSRLRSSGAVVAAGSSGVATALATAGRNIAIAGNFIFAPFRPLGRAIAAAGTAVVTALSAAAARIGATSGGGAIGGLLGRAAGGARAGGAALAALPALGTIAAGAVAAFAVYEAQKKISAIVKAADEATQQIADAQFGSADDLRQSAKDLRTASSQARDESSGIFGGLLDTLNGDKAGKAASRADAVADLQERAAARIDAINKEASRSADPTQIRLDLTSSESLDASLKILDDSGRSATTQLNALKQALDNVGNAAGSATGGLTRTEGQILGSNAAPNIRQKIAGIADEQGFKGGFEQLDLGGRLRKVGTLGFNNDKHEDYRDILDAVDNTKLDSGINDTIKQFTQDNNGIPDGLRPQLIQLIQARIKASIPEFDKLPKEVQDQVLATAKDVVDEQYATLANLKDPKVSLDALLKVFQPLAQKAAEQAATGFQLSGESLSGTSSSLVGSQTLLTSLEDARAAAESKGADATQLEQFDVAIQRAKLDVQAAAVENIDSLGALMDAVNQPFDKSGVLQNSIDRVNAKLAITTDPDKIRQLQTERAKLEIQAGQQALADQQASRDRGTDTRDAVGNATNAVTTAREQLDFLIANGAKGEDLDKAYADLAKAQVGMANAGIDNANAARSAAVALGDGVAEANAEYLNLLNTASGQIGATRAATLRQAAATNVRVQQARDDRTTAQASARRDPRDTVGVARDALAADRRALGTLRRLTPNDATGIANLQRKIAEDRISVASAQRQADAAIALAGKRLGDTVGRARVTVAATRADLRAALPGTKEYADLQDKLASDLRALATAQRDLGTSIRLAGLFPGDEIGAAKINLASAKDALKDLDKGTKEYYDQLREIRQQQQALADLELQAAAQAGRLRIDLTDPVAVARAATQEARAKLASDRKNGADKNTLNADTEAVRRAESAEDQAAFTQRLSDAQTNERLGRISHAAYQEYLKSERTRLQQRLAGLKVTDNGYRQALDQLNQVEEALKTAADAAGSQFNLGDIKIPTPFEVRRSIAGQVSVIKQSLNAAGEEVGKTGGANSNLSVAVDGIRTDSAVTRLNALRDAINQLSGAAPVGAVSTPADAAALATAKASAVGTTHNYVQIDGADMVQVKQFLTALLGVQATSRTPVSAGRKV